MTFNDAVYQRVLRGVAEGDFNLIGIPDVSNLFNQLRKYRAKLPSSHPLKKCVLPDEGSPATPVSATPHCQRIKLKTESRN